MNENKKFCISYNPLPSTNSNPENNCFNSLEDAVLYYLKNYRQDASIIINGKLKINPWDYFNTLIREFDNVKFIQDELLKRVKIVEKLHK